MVFKRMIRKMGLGYIIGRMRNIMLGSGKMGNKMDWGSILKEIMLGMVYGKMERKKVGLGMKMSFLIIWMGILKSLSLCLEWKLERLKILWKLNNFCYN